jgi:MFS family permease
MDATPWRDVLVTRFSALRHRNFRLYVGGQIISLTGTWMQTVAQGWLMHRLTDSAFWLGLLGFTQFLPVMLLSLWAGAVIDRMDKRRLLCLTQGAFLLQATLLALVVTTGVVRPWMVLALAGVFGMVNAFDMPTRHSFVVEMTSREDIGNAIAINSAVFNSARIVGPAVAGILLATVGEGGCFWLNALSYVAVLVCLARMELPRREFCRRGASLGAGLAEGVRYAWRTRALRNLLLLLGITAGIGFQYQLLLPVYARVVLHAGPKVYGLLLTAFGAGALVGALRLTGRPGRPGLRFNLMLGLGACAVGLGVFAWSRLIPLSLVAGALAGFGLIVYVGSTNTLLQLTTDDRYRGRVMSLYTLMFSGTTPIGALMAGAIAQRWNAPIATTASAAFMLLGAGLVAWRFAPLTRTPPGRVAEPPPVERLD